MPSSSMTVSPVLGFLWVGRVTDCPDDAFSAPDARYLALVQPVEISPIEYPRYRSPAGPLPAAAGRAHGDRAQVDAMPGFATHACGAGPHALPKATSKETTAPT